MWTAVEDAIATCVKSGYDPEWLIGLDCTNFSEVHASVMRTLTRDRMWQLNAMTCVQNPGKKGEHHKAMMGQLKQWITFAEIKQTMGSGDDLARAVKR